MDLPRSVRNTRSFPRSQSTASELNSPRFVPLSFKHCLAVVLLALPLCVLNEISSAQKRPPQFSLPSNIQQSGAPKQQNPVKKGGTKTIAQAPGTVAQQPDPPVPVAPLTFKLQVDSARVRPGKELHPGEEVTFTLIPSRPLDQFPFVFVFDYQDGEPITEFGQTSQVHRFLTEGAHEVSVTIPPGKQQSGQTTRLAVIELPTVANKVTVKVDKIPLKVTAPPGDAKPPFVVGQQLSFATEYNSSDPTVRYRFVFDDAANTGSDWLTTPKYTYAYPNPGTYTVRAEVRFTSDKTLHTSTSEAQPIQIDRLPPDSLLSLTADPNKREASKPITFTATLDSTKFNSTFYSKIKDIRYRFVFDDGEQSEWSDALQVEHSYKSAGVYRPHVEVGLDDGRGLTRTLLSSTAKPVEVFAPAKPPDPWPYLIIIIVVIVVVGTSLLYFSYRLLSRKPPTFTPDVEPGNPPPHQPLAPHPTIVLHTDERTAEVEKPRLAVNFQVRFNRGIGSSESSLTTTEASFIKSERRRNV